MPIREWLTRLAGTLRRSRRDEDLEEELRLHMELAAEAEARRGHAPDEAHRLARLHTGGTAQAMDLLRDQRGLPSLDALRADIVFGWRQISRHRVASLSAILSLGLAMGAMMAASRLVDAVLLRPMPVADPDRLFVVTNTYRDSEGGADERDDADYPTFRRYAATVGDRADLMVMGSAVRQQVRIDGGETEHAAGQLVSGNVFSTLGLQPALGRLISPADDEKPGARPVMVLAHQYWMRRFGGDPAAIGRSIRTGFGTLEIVGIAPEPFTGTEPGLMSDFFMPAKLNAEALESPGWSWFRIWVRPRPNVDPREVEALLQARFHADHVERAKSFPADTPKSRLDAFMSETLHLAPAGAGVSTLQKSFRRPLWILAALAALLLLIACANVANLLLARAMARRVEMALRVSIGASRGRLVQLMLIESALVGIAACATGAVFAAWAAPFVVSMLAPAGRPVRLDLGLDWRTFISGAAITFGVTLLFGVLPALRASRVRPAGALKSARIGGGQRRLTDAIVAAQMAVCVFLLFGAALFVGTLDRLHKKPLGFDPARMLHVTLSTTQRTDGAGWRQIADSLRAMPRVEAVALSAWSPLSGNRWRSSITAPGVQSPATAPNWVNVGPGYFAAMKTRLLDGRDFTADDIPPHRADGRIVAGTAIVNEAFARVYFAGASPVGRQVIVNSSEAPMRIVGLVQDSVYFNVRETMHPAVYIPFAVRDGATLLVRTAPGAADLRTSLAREIVRLHPALRVREVEPFEAFITQQMVRERLLAALSTFFASLALVLAAIGMYGVLNYSVTRERREIGIRMALGATSRQVVSLITVRVVLLLFAGTAAGLAGGLALGRAAEVLLFGIAPTDALALAPPVIALAVAAMLAALPPARRAIRVDPVEALKVES